MLTSALSEDIRSTAHEESRQEKKEKKDVFEEWENHTFNEVKFK